MKIQVQTLALTHCQINYYLFQFRMKSSPHSIQQTAVFLFSCAAHSRLERSSPRCLLGCKFSERLKHIQRAAMIANAFCYSNSLYLNIISYYQILMCYYLRSYQQLSPRSPFPPLNPTREETTTNGNNCLIFKQHVSSIVLRERESLQLKYSLLLTVCRSLRYK